jgi:hypothetical protein
VGNRGKSTNEPLFGVEIAVGKCLIEGEKASTFIIGVVVCVIISPRRLRDE